MDKEIQYFFSFSFIFFVQYHVKRTFVCWGGSATSILGRGHAPSRIQIGRRLDDIESMSEVRCR